MVVSGAADRSPELIDDPSDCLGKGTYPQGSGEQHKGSNYRTVLPITWVQSVTYTLDRSADGDALPARSWRPRYSASNKSTGAVATPGV